MTTILPSDAVPPDDRVEALLGDSYQDIFDTVRECVRDVLKTRASISPETVLLDLGADSITLTKLVFALEQRYRIRLPGAFSVPDEFDVNTFVRGVAAGLIARSDQVA